MPKAYSYIRMSTETQLKGDSLRRQLEKSARFAKEQELELDTTFDLRDIGFSAFDGSNIDRGQLGKFLIAVKQGKVERGSYLIVESLDRLTRQKVLPALRIFLDLLDHGITIATLIDKKVFRPDDVDHNDLMYSLGCLTRSHEESVTKSERVSDAWQEKRKRIGSEILTKRCVAWLKPKEDRSGFELLEDRAEIVRRIFQEATDMGIGADLIARRLNRMQVAPFGRANGWHKSYVLKILTNRAVIGEFQPRSKSKFGKRKEFDVVPGYYPSIIDESTFYRTQEALERRRQNGAGRKGSRISNLFTGLLFCGSCCGPMHYLNKGAKGGRILVCDTARRGLGCYGISWRYEDFERSFLAFVTGLDIQSLFGETKVKAALETARNRLDELKGRVSKLECERERTYRLAIDGELTEYLKQKLKHLEDQIGSLRAEMTGAEADQSKALEEHRASVTHKADMLSLIERLQSDDTPDVVTSRLRIAARLRQVVKEILVFPGGLLPSKDELREHVEEPFDIDLVMQAMEVMADERAFSVEFHDGTLTVISPSMRDALEAEYVVSEHPESVT